MTALSLVRWCAVFLFLSQVLRAAVPVDSVVDLQATASATAPYLTLSWTQRQQSAITSQKMYRRLKGAATWDLQATLTNTQTSYPDNTAARGVEYEYWMERRFTGVSPSVAIGYLSGGVDVPFTENRGTLLLVIDNTMIAPLAPEIAQLKEDLVGDGWTVQTISVSRTDTPPAVRSLIQAAYTASPTTVKAVYLLGHVPVPYSGLLAPDGHIPDHYGAWPADAYYGDMDGTWADTSINNTGAGGTRQDNIPGDGKFDPTSIPSDVELEVGRVDMANMTKAPVSAVSEATLLRRYLRKAHDFRHQLGAYAAVAPRSMIRDGFGQFSGESFASSGWAAAYSCVSRSVDQPASNAWFTQAATATYLFGYGCGGGSYESASTVGTSAEFGRKTSRVVFTGMFGSYHGDWDSTNNLMRAVLAGNTSGDSLGLACFWAGRPHWFLHPCGFGENIGYAARLAQNNSFSNYQFANSSPRGVHIALMGDPALRFHVVQPPRNVAANSSSGQVQLEWDASSDKAVLGYHVWRTSSAAGPFTRLTTVPLSTPAFTDAAVTPGQSYTYLVRTLKLETAPGGTYQNLSEGILVSQVVSAAATAVPFNPSGLSVKAMSSTQTQLTWTDNSTDETGFRIERRTNVAGAFTTLTTVPPNTTTFTDPGPLTNGNVYYYRVVATSAAGDSLPSNEAAIDGAAGFVEANDARLKVSKTAGSASLIITRFGGITGATQVSGATNDVSAVAGTHYTAVSSPVSFADGENASKNVTISFLNNGQPQLPRQLRYAITSPTNGAVLGAQASTRVLIEDPTATLTAGWSQAILGTVEDSSPAVFAEGAFGSSLDGGAVTTGESGRFIYQSRTGDGTITAFVDAPLPAQNAARIGVMVRASTATGDLMASALVAGDTTGTNLFTRDTGGATAVVTPNSANNLKAPRWVRVTRSGNIFTAETSADGTSWTALGSSTVAMPATASWGLFHASDGNSSDFQLARFRYVTITDVGALGTPVNVIATAQSGPARNPLVWDPIGGATGYRIERRALNGSFTPLGVSAGSATTFADTTARPGVIYEYRVQASSGAVLSGWSTVVTIATSGTATAYQQWLKDRTLPMDETGSGSPTAAPAGDGISNALKFGLGLDPKVPGYANRLITDTTNVSGQGYLSLAYTRPEPPPTGVVYSVETSGDLTAWSAGGIVPVGETVSGATRTITVRDNVPASGETARRFIRLQVTLP